VIGSVVYLTLLVIQLPARREADRIYDRVLQVGEMAVYREQMAKR